MTTTKYLTESGYVVCDDHLDENDQATAKPLKAGDTYADEDCDFCAGDDEPIDHQPARGDRERFYTQ